MKLTNEVSRHEKLYVQNERIDTNWREHKNLAKQNGICYITYNKRVVRAGMSPYDAATKPLQERNNVYTVRGVTGTRQRICDHFGVNLHNVVVRMSRKKITFEEAIKETLK